MQPASYPPLSVASLLAEDSACASSIQNPSSHSLCMSFSKPLVDVATPLANPSHDTDGRSTSSRERQSRRASKSGDRGKLNDEQTPPSSSRNAVGSNSSDFSPSASSSSTFLFELLSRRVRRRASQARVEAQHMTVTARHQRVERVMLADTEAEARHALQVQEQDISRHYLIPYYRLMMDYRRRQAEEAAMTEVAAHGETVNSMGGSGLRGVSASERPKWRGPSTENVLPSGGDSPRVSSRMERGRPDSAPFTHANSHGRGMHMTTGVGPATAGAVPPDWNAAAVVRSRKGHIHKPTATSQPSVRRTSDPLSTITEPSAESKGDAPSNGANHIIMAPPHDGRACRPAARYAWHEVMWCSPSLIAVDSPTRSEGSRSSPSRVFASYVARSVNPYRGGGMEVASGSQTRCPTAAPHVLAVNTPHGLVAHGDEAEVSSPTQEAALSRPLFVGAAENPAVGGRDNSRIREGHLPSSRAESMPSPRHRHPPWASVSDPGRSPSAYPASPIRCEVSSTPFSAIYQAALSHHASSMLQAKETVARAQLQSTESFEAMQLGRVRACIHTRGEM